MTVADGGAKGGSTKPYRKNVGALVFNRAGQVLAGERAGKPGALQFPQGGLDKGERPEEAARRELWEETGLGIEEGPVHEIEDWLAYDFPPAIENPKLKKYRGQTQKWFFYRWDGDPATLDVDHHHREFDRLLWTDMEAVVAAIKRFAPFKGPVYERVAAELAAFLGRREQGGDSPE